MNKQNFSEDTNLRGRFEKWDTHMRDECVWKDLRIYKNYATWYLRQSIYVSTYFCTLSRISTFFSTPA